MIFDAFAHDFRESLEAHMLEFAFEPKEVRKALQNANEWSPPPPPAKSNQYQAWSLRGSFH